jgi:hypothetical protein
MERLQTILSMEKKPEAEARYLVDLYQNEAPQLAKDCETIFLDAGDKKAGDYWSRVCACIKPLMTKH